MNYFFLTRGGCQEDVQECLGLRVVLGRCLGTLGICTIKENNISQGMRVREPIYFRGWGGIGKMLRDDMETLGNVRKMLGDVKEKKLR
jgi:hypothetical protein